METKKTEWRLSELSDLRIAYDRGRLLEEDLKSTPLEQFEAWWREVRESGSPEPNAMTLATADGSGVPSSRTVLMKGIDAEGFRFFTHQGSRKARAMEENPRVALLFPWLALQRQVSVLGAAERMGAAESEAYFRSRPRGSQLAAWVSRQSCPVENRAALDRRMAEMEARWPEGMEVPMPGFWGGYLVRPDSVEFWQGRPSRLHDRLRFEAVRAGAPLNEAGAWRVRRYAP